MKNKSSLLFLLLLFLFSSMSSFGQKIDFNVILLSIESDYFYSNKARTRKEILIDYVDSVVYYRKKSCRKFKKSDLPINLFFKDSINYLNLEDLITNHEKSNCNFRNKGSIKITLIKGESSQNYARTYEFGSVISCKNEDDYLILQKIRKEYFDMINQIFN